MLEIMRHIHVFVTRYCYNLNNQASITSHTKVIVCMCGCVCVPILCVWYVCVVSSVVIIVFYIFGII